MTANTLESREYTQTGNTVSIQEVMPSPSERYKDLGESFPFILPTLNALDKISENSPLPQKDQDSLVTFSFWIEAPDAIDDIAQALQMTRDQVQENIDHVADNLEDLWEEIEELKEEEEEEDEVISIVTVPLFEKPVKAGSRKTRSYNLELIDNKEFLLERLEETLPKRQFTVTKMHIEGKSDEEIAGELGISVGSVVRLRSRARSRAEREILFPAGFFRLRHERRSQEVVVIRGDDAEGVNFLGYWYGTEHGANVFDQRTRKVDAEMIEQGREPLSWYVYFDPAKDYEWILKNGRKRGLLQKHKNRWYGKKADILALMDERGVSQEAPRKTEPWRSVIQRSENGQDLSL